MAADPHDRNRSRAGGISAGAALAILLAPALSLAAVMARVRGPGPAARFAAAAAGALAAQQSLVALALQRHAGGNGPRRLGAVDLLTLGRGLAAAVLVGVAASGLRERQRLPGWTGWVALCGGSVLCDWLDGPIARRLGTSRDGAMFDLEADSWLTLAAAIAAVAWGDLPGYCLAPPALRYGLLGMSLRRMPYAEVFAGEPPWARWSGIAQMLLFTAALAPFGGRVTRLAVRLAAPAVTSGQLGVMLTRRRRRGARADGP